MSRKNRSLKSLKRREPFKLPRNPVVILCEGQTTEPGYFKSLRKQWSLSSLQVTIVGEECDSAPISIVDYAKSQKDEHNTIWCIMDVEQHKTLAGALQEAKDNGVQVALSNPCFEFWFLLHFEQPAGSFPRGKDVQKALQAWHPGYKKGKPATFGEFYAFTNRAIRNSKAVLRAMGNPDDLSNCNPSTHIHRVVENLKNLRQGARV